MREEKQTDLFKKLIAVNGDVGEENLGLSLEDRTTLINNVQIIFHSAATLDFEADLKNTTNINLLGTRRIVELCQEIKNFKVNVIFTVDKDIFYRKIAYCIIYIFFFNLFHQFIL